MDTLPSRLIRLHQGTMGLFSLALLYQLFHWIEHVVQVYQHWLRGMPAAQSHGILFFLDFEWNHFVFNTGYFIALLVVLILIITKRQVFDIRASALWLLGIGTAIQGYHQIEHIVKISQHLARGCEPCPGISSEKPSTGCTFISP
ncbi:MAG: hypothetical protein Q8R39_00120 [bacterium]|nr:hypothetical protein [bacterium]